jgi:hypothetical protein
MSPLFAKRKLVFRPTEQFEVDIRGMDRQEKLDRINYFAKHDYFEVNFKGFIHLLDSFSVKRGEWVEVVDSN